MTDALFSADGRVHPDDLPAAAGLEGDQMWAEYLAHNEAWPSSLLDDRVIGRRAWKGEDPIDVSRPRRPEWVEVLGVERHDDYHVSGRMEPTVFLRCRYDDGHEFLARAANLTAVRREGVPL